MTARSRDTTAPADVELISSIGRRDREAFRQLYMAYFGRLGRFLCRITTRPQLIEEVINDTMLVVWNSADRFRGDSRPSTWIFGIAYRVALKAIDRDRRALPPAQDTIPIEQAGEELAVDDLLDRAELDDWLGMALDRLSPEHRLSLELAHFMGFTCEEIARITGCPVGTVKSRIHHARVHLRNSLRQLAASSAAGDGRSS
jgi:RNA polymerase sigma-70 factor (ECF subfamily)